MTKFSWGSATDVGRVRQANEDSMFSVDGLFIVADGMGGHRGGAVASRMAVESVHKFFTEKTTDALVAAVENANDALVERSNADPDLEGMGTTLVALALVVGADHDEERDLLAVVNIGDSRLYLLKEGELEQITEDHSLVATLERQGRLTRAEAAVHPQRNVLTRAMGIDERVLVDSWEILPFVGDRYLLCSDGLFNEVDHNRIESTLRKLSDPDEAARELVRLANENAGRDNITCVVVDVINDDGRDPDADADDERVTSAVHGPERVIAAGVSASKSSDESSGDSPEQPDHVAAGNDEQVAQDAGASDQPKRTSRFTWRVLLFLLIFMMLIAAVLGSIIYSGTGTYYVGFDGETVAIFRGRPGGVLWIQPRLIETTDLERDVVPAQYLADLEKGRSQPSIEDARRYIDNLRSQIPVTARRTDSGNVDSTGSVPGNTGSSVGGNQSSNQQGNQQGGTQGSDGQEFDDSTVQ